MISRCLAKTNAKEVRLLGFESLLLFVEALQNSFEQKQIDLFAAAINLQPFIDGDNVQLKHQIPSNSKSFF